MNLWPNFASQTGWKDESRAQKLVPKYPKTLNLHSVSVTIGRVGWFWKNDMNIFLNASHMRISPGIAAVSRQFQITWTISSFSAGYHRNRQSIDTISSPQDCTWRTQTFSLLAIQCLVFFLMGASKSTWPLWPWDSQVHQVRLRMMTMTMMMTTRTTTITTKMLMMMMMMMMIGHMDGPANGRTNERTNGWMDWWC